MHITFVLRLFKVNLCVGEGWVLVVSGEALVGPRKIARDAYALAHSRTRVSRASAEDQARIARQGVRWKTLLHVIERSRGPCRVVVDVL